jgi:DNA-binding PadR family transcriptional regulator
VIGKVYAPEVGVSQKMLTQTLQQLKRDGLVRRNVHPTVPPAVDYALTPLGESLMRHIRGFRDWTEVYFPCVERAREEYDRKAKDETCNQGRKSHGSGEFGSSVYPPGNRRPPHPFKVS